MAVEGSKRLEEEAKKELPLSWPFIACYARIRSGVIADEANGHSVFLRTDMTIIPC